LLRVQFGPGRIVEEMTRAIRWFPYWYTVTLLLLVRG
jgi:hypothetical protein